MQIQVKMKIDRSIDCVNECEPLRKYYQFMNNSKYGFVQNMTTGWTGASNSGTGIVFCPYIPQIFTPSNLYPHVIKPFNLNTEKDEIKTKIRYRQFKRFKATRR